MFEKDPLATLFLLLTGVQALALAGAWVWARRSGGVPQRLIAAWERLADRRGRGVLLVFVTALTLCAGLSLVRWPAPRVQDEFSYLLAGETFASGRLTNPTHPMWPHLETEHVLQRPTYMSKYPPAQGLTLAAGIVLAGEPMLGVWLGVAAACAAVCWMLYGVAPARWALLGGMLAATHPGVLGWWGHSMWGGQVAMLGGALLLGAVARIVKAGRDVRAAHALVMGVGLLVLANSRPYEGFMAALAAGTLLAWAVLVRRRPPFGVALMRVAAPAAAVLALGAAGMMEYNRAVTGDPLRMPYQEHNRQYGATPLFLWQDPPPEPEYRDRKLRDFHGGWEKSLYLRQREGAYGLLKFGFHKLLIWNGFYIGPALGMAMLGLLRRTVMRDRLNVIAGAVVLWCLGASLVCVWFNPHYVAPAAPVVFLLIVQGVRSLAGAGERLRRLAVAAVAGQAVSTAALFALVPMVYPAGSWERVRAGIIKRLTEAGGEHLVILRHGREYSPHQEWVYNGPDVDASPVVWARELDSAACAELRRYFAGRQMWLLQAYRAGLPDGTPAPLPELAPYPDAPDWLAAPPRRLLPEEPVNAVAVASASGGCGGDVLVAPAGRAVIEVYSADSITPRATIPLPGPAAAICTAATERGTAVIAAIAGQAVIVVADVPCDGAAVAPAQVVPIGAAARQVSAFDASEGKVVIAAACPELRAVELIAEDEDVWRVAGRVSVPGVPAAAVCGDVTGDGAPDLAAADSVQGVVWLARGVGEGMLKFGEPERIADAMEPLAVAMADLDGDGTLDLVAAEARMDRVLVLLGRGDGFEQQRLHTGIAPVGVAAAELNGDGRPDLAVATKWGHGLTFLGSDAAAAFAAPAEITLGTQTWFEEKASSVAVGDVDGDGRDDVVVGAARGVFVYRTSASRE